MITFCLSLITYELVLAACGLLWMGILRILKANQ